MVVNSQSILSVILSAQQLLFIKIMQLLAWGGMIESCCLFSNNGANSLIGSHVCFQHFAVTQSAGVGVCYRALLALYFQIACQDHIYQITDTACHSTWRQLPNGRTLPLLDSKHTKKETHTMPGILKWYLAVCKLRVTVFDYRIYSFGLCLYVPALAIQRICPQGGFACCLRFLTVGGDVGWIMKSSEAGLLETSQWYTEF